jgi:hypothetical protein
MEINRSLESDKKRPSGPAARASIRWQLSLRFPEFSSLACYLLIYFASHFGGRRAGGSSTLQPRVRCVRITRSYT